MKRAITTVIAATLVFAAGRAAAGPTDVNPGDIAAVADKLQVTAKQRQQIRNLHDNARKATIKLRADIEASGIDLRRELERDVPNEAKVRQLIARISQMEGKARQARVTAWLRIRKLLSAKQRAMLALVNEGKNHWAKTMRHDMRAHLRKRLAELKRNRLRMERQARAMETRARAMEKRARVMERAERKRMRKLQRKLEHEMRRKLKHEHRHQHRYKGLKDPFSSSQPRGPASVTINAKPHAKIYIDGKLVGTTPLKTMLPGGGHVVRAKSAKGERVKRIHVDPGKVMVLTFTY